MFVDLVGSTALSTGMDPEDLGEVISAYQKRVAETVPRFDGFVRDTWATVSSYILVILWPTRTMPSKPGAAGWRSSRPCQIYTRWRILGCRSALVSRLESPSWETSSARAFRRTWLATRRTLRRGCRGLPSQTRWSFPKRRAGFSAISLS